MKRWSVLIMVGVLLVTTLACGGRGNGGASNAGQIKIEVVNYAPEDICYVYISDSNSIEWGDDQLGNEDTIVTGDSMTFEFPKGEYDARVENCDEVVMETAWRITSNATITAGASDATSWVLFDNQSSVDVCYVFISPSDSDDWGDDWMGGNENVPSGERRLFYVSPGTYDLLAQDCDRQDLVKVSDVDLMNGRPWILSDN